MQSIRWQECTPRSASCSVSVDMDTSVVAIIRYWQLNIRQGKATTGNILCNQHLFENQVLLEWYQIAWKRTCFSCFYDQPPYKDLSPTLEQSARLHQAQADRQQQTHSRAVGRIKCIVCLCVHSNWYQKGGRVAVQPNPRRHRTSRTPNIHHTHTRTHNIQVNSFSKCVAPCVRTQSWCFYFTTPHFISIRLLLLLLPYVVGPHPALLLMMVLAWASALVSI